MIDGEKNTDIESEMNKVEMPGNKQILVFVCGCIYIHQLITIKKKKLNFLLQGLNRLVNSCLFTLNI